MGRLVVRAELEAITQSFRTEMLAARQQIDRLARGVGQTNRNFRTFQSRLNSAGRSLRGLAGAVIGFGIVNSIQALGREFVTTANAMQLMQGRIQLVTRELGNSIEVSNALFDISQRTRSANQTIANSFSRLAVAVNITAENYKDLLGVTEALALTGAISGTGTVERQNVLTQAIQALASGVLRGDELRTIRESDPRLTRLLTDIARQNDSTLKAFAEQGKFTRDLLVRELNRELQTLRTEFTRLPATVSQVFTRMRNTINLAIVDFDAFFGVNDRILGVLRNVESSLNPTNYVRLAIALHNIRENLLSIVNPLRVVLGWLTRFNVGVNTLSAALYGLPFLGLAKALTGLGQLGVRAYSRFRGQQAFLRRELRRQGQDLTDLDVDFNTRTGRGGLEDFFSGRPFSEAVRQRIKNIDDLRDRYNQFSATMGKVRSTFDATDRAVIGGFLGGVSLIGIAQGLSGYNALTDGIDNLVKRQIALGQILPTINAHLGKRGQIYDELTGKVRKFNEEEKKAYDRGAAARKQLEFEDRLNTFRRETFIYEYGPYIGLLEREDRLLKDIRRAEEQRVRVQRDRLQARPLEDELVRLRNELEKVQAEQRKVFNSSAFNVRSLEAFAKLTQSANQTAGAIGKVTRSWDQLKKLIEGLDLSTIPTEIIRPFSQSEIRGGITEADLEYWVPRTSRYRSPERMARRFIEANRKVAGDLKLTDDDRRRYLDFLARKRGRETGTELAERLRLESAERRTAKIRLELNTLAERHNRILVATQNILTNISTQMINLFNGSQGWADSLRNVLNNLARIFVQYRIIEPIARRVAAGYDPAGARAVETLRRQSQGLILNLVAPGGLITRGTGTLSPGLSQNNSGNTNINLNVVGTPGSMDMFRTGNSDVLSNVFRFLAANHAQIR